MTTTQNATSDDSWKAGFQAALRSFLMRKGSIREESDFAIQFGWQDFNALEHLRARTATEYSPATKGCTLILPEGDIEIATDHLSQFVDTYSGNREIDLVQIAGVTCACGEIGTDRTLAWEGSPGELIQGVVTS